MKQLSQALAIIILFAACNTSAYKKGRGGLEYKIITEGKNPLIKYGEFMQLNYATYYNNGKSDSLLEDTRNTVGPMIQMFDSVSTPMAYYEILRQLRKGDSLLIRIKTDSAFKGEMAAQMPPFMQKGHYLITAVKVINVFSDRQQADSAQMTSDSLHNAVQLEKDDKAIKEYLAKNNIKAEKAARGTYVEITKPGEGALLDTSVVAKVNYTGRTIEGEMFDSNTDPSKGHVEPFLVNLTTDGSLGSPVIQGWYDGLKLMKKGSVGRLFIPSTLAYGKFGRPPVIKSNDILIFDIEVLDILNKQQAKIAAEITKAKAKERQEKWMDSIKAANAKKTDSINAANPGAKKP